MPVWARTFYIGKIVEFKEAQNAEYEKQAKKAKAKR
jgi:hypothetical protein